MYFLKKDLKKLLGIESIQTLNNFLTDEKIQGQLMALLSFSAYGIKVFDGKKLKSFYKNYRKNNYKKSGRKPLNKHLETKD